MRFATFVLRTMEFDYQPYASPTSDGEPAIEADDSAVLSVRYDLDGKMLRNSLQAHLSSGGEPGGQMGAAAFFVVMIAVIVIAAQTEHLEASVLTTSYVLAMFLSVGMVLAARWRKRTKLQKELAEQGIKGGESLQLRLHADELVLIAGDTDHRFPLEEATTIASTQFFAKAESQFSTLVLSPSMVIPLPYSANYGELSYVGFHATLHKRIERSRKSGMRQLGQWIAKTFSWSR